MLFTYDLEQLPVCTRFGRMVQRDRWNRQGIAQKAVNLLVYIVAGEAVFTIGQNAIPVCGGDVLLIPAGMPYSADTDDMCDYYFYHFTGRMLPIAETQPYPTMVRDFSFELPPVTQRRVTLMQKTRLAEVNSRFYNYVAECEDLHNRSTFSGRLAIDHILCRLLLLLAEITEGSNSATGYPLVLDRMLGYIRKNLTGTITTAELCRYCDVSGSYAARIFKKHMNTTITQYITDQKLEYACELMRNTGMNVSQIASYLGFCDVYYFSRRFKEKYGKAPSRMFRRG